MHRGRKELEAVHRLRVLAREAAQRADAASGRAALARRRPGQE
jgi:hypothetical protein